MVLSYLISLSSNQPFIILCLPLHCHLVSVSLHSQLVDMPSVLERFTSFPTALPVSLQLSLLCYLFAMPLQCSPLEIFIPEASLSLLELSRILWSFPDFCRASQSSPEFSSCCRSSSYLTGVPAFALEFLLLPWSSLPSEFFADPL